MDKTKIQKVNKALIATVFATSGIAVVIPPPQKAAAATSPFIDINQYSSHYENILKLYSQGAISGFADKTFRPNQNVTRGQAAKMLATVLKLDVKNVEDPYFKDVPKSNEYYKYVAALQNAGIMAGYSNGTFMPNEVVTRGQLAKILVLGFKFEVASNYNHSFQDVTSQTSNAAYIQTLVDLKVTEGTTPVTFSPFNAVTRGQIASFIVRSQDKKSNATSYKVTGVEDDIIYINAEPYTVPESLAHIFNEYNADVLKGALIEGDLSGKTLYSVSKLTLNASGTSSRFLELDGENGSFGATIVVNGNYIEFSNVTLTGTMLVNETVRPPLQLNVSTYKPLAIGRVASNNLSFINWSNPEKPEEDNSTNNNPSTDLQNWTNQNPDKDKPFVNWSKDKVTMKNVEKHIEFYNSSVSRLVVSQSGTKIETNTKLPRVDIIGNVREFEIQGNIGTLNLDTETKLTIYGDSNIDWINYNSFTDLELYIDGRVGTLYVDNAYGWIDIGDYTYIDKVIIPKGESPNNIFDDFLEDKDNVGSITDPDGKPIDKDDIDNQKPSDKTKPNVEITKVTVLNGREVQVDFHSNEVGTYYYVVREEGVAAPTKREIKDPKLSNLNIKSGSSRAVEGNNTIKVSDLGEKKEYVIYLMVIDGANNVSDVKSQEFKMKDATPPTVTGINVNPLPGGKRAEATFTTTELGEYYYIVRKKTTPSTPPTAEEVAKSTNKGTADELKETFILDGLEAKTEYELFLVMKDDSGNLSKLASTGFPTLELDEIQPYIPIEKQKLDLTGTNQITVHFSEPLDEEAALNVKNYVLSGTGIMNISGQKEINPSKVEYKKNDTKVTLTIPSATGLVNNDTIRVTIQPTLYDRARNEFENSRTHEKPRNFAVYTHDDTVGPFLKINGIETNEYEHGLLKVHATKAGTYYYVILPSNNKVSDLSMRDIMDKKLKALLPSGTNNELTVQDVPLTYYGGSKAIEMGDSTLEIPIANNLTKFHSWNIYIFMADRSGNLTKEIQTIELVKDRTAPTITQGIVRPQKGDATAKLEITSNEAGQIRYILRRKDEQSPTIEEVERSSNTLELIEGPQTTHEFAVPEAHKDYMLYYIAEDKAKNATTLQHAEFYSDGTKPEVEDIIVRDGNEFEITFSEAIMRGMDEKSTISLKDGDSLESLLAMTGANLSDYKFVSYSEGTKTTDKSKLKIKFTGTPSINVDKTFNITMKPDVIDSVKANHKFELADFGKYVFRSLDTMFVYAKLVQGDNKKVEVLVDLLFPSGSQEFDKDEVITYYYLSAPIGTDENIIKGKTPEKIIEDVLSGQSNSLAKGKDEFKPDDSRFKEILNHPVEFVENDWIMIVLEDKYGNLTKTYQRVGYVYKP